MRKGAARFIPMNGTPTYIQKPNAEIVAIMAEMTPNKPSNGFDFTQSVIIQVMMQNPTISPMFKEKYGITEFVLFSSSRSSVKEVNRNTSISGNFAFAKTFRKASSHSVPLKLCENYFLLYINN